MKYCEKCRVSVAGNRQRCPLCQGELRTLDDCDTEVFPQIPTLYRKYNFFFRSLILASVAAGVICVMINMILPRHGWWSLFVLAGIVCVWVSLAIAVRKRHNIPKVVLYQVVVVSALAVFWDYFIGWRGWSVDYVLPIICIVAMIVLAIAAKVIEMNVGSTVIYFTIAAFFGVMPLAFLITGRLAVKLPSLICSAGSMITLAALFIFQWENVISELKRRLHM